MIEQSKYSEWSHLFWQKALFEQLEEHEAIGGRLRSKPTEVN